MALLVNETFTGTNGAAWATAWTSVVGSPGTIQSNAGQLISPSGSSFGSARMDYRGMSVAGDIDVSCTVIGTVSGVEQYAGLSINGDLADNSTNNNFAPGNSYTLSVNYNATAASSTISINQYVGGTKTVLVTSGSITLTGTTSYTMRFRRQGQLLAAKIWASASAEPTAWTITNTFTSVVPFAGFVSLSVGTGNTVTTARTFAFDNLLLNDFTVPLTYNETWPATANTIWPAPWSLVRGTALVTAGGGQLSSIGGTTSARIDMNGMASSARSEVLVQVTGAATSIGQTVNIGICCDPTSELATTNIPVGFVYLQINYASTAANSSIGFWQKDTQIGSTVTRSLTGTTAYNVRVLRSGSLVAAKMWDASTTEPTAWDISAAASSINNPAASGVVSIACGDSGGGTASRTFTFSNLTIYPTIGDAPYTDTFTSNVSNVQISNLWAQGLGTSIVTSNALRITAQSGDTAPGRVDYVGMAPLRDMEVFAQFTGTTAGVAQRVLIGLNTVTGSELGYGQSTNEIYLELIYNATPASSILTVWQGTTQISGNVAFTATGTTTYCGRIRRQNGFVYAKVWAASGAEPTAWMITLPMSSFTEPNPTGTASLKVNNGSDGTQRTFIFDNFAVYDLSPALPYNETFTSNVDTVAWPGAWTTLTGTSQIVGNTGQLTSPSGAYNVARADLQMAKPSGDTEILTRVTCLVAGVEQYVAVGFNSDPTNPIKTQSLYLNLNYSATPASSSLVLWQGTNTITGSITKTLVGTTTYSVRVRRYAGVLYGKVWPAFTVEPAAWDLTFNLSSAPYPAPLGVPMVDIACGADGVQRTAVFSNMTIYDTSALLPYNEYWPVPYAGSGWPGTWSTSLPAGSGGIADFQQNGARLIGGTSATYAQVRQFMQLPSASNDFDMYITYMFNQQAESYLNILLRSDNLVSSANTGMPQNGYFFQIKCNTTVATGNYYIAKSVANSKTDLTTATINVTAGQQSALRVQCVGPIIRWKMWQANADEPVAWTGSTTDPGTQPTAGYVGIGVGNGNSATACSVTLTTISVTPASVAPSYTDILTGSNLPNLSGAWQTGAPVGRVAIRGNAAFLVTRNSAVRRDLTMTAISDSEVSCVVINNTTDTNTNIFWIGTNAGTDAGNVSTSQWYAQLSWNTTAANSTVQIFNGTTSKSSVTMTLVVGVPYNVRFQALGTAMRTKVWRADANEPTAWTSTFTAGAAGTAGVVSMGAQGLSTSKDVTFTVDNINVSLPGGRLKAYANGLVTTKTIRVWNGTTWVSKPAKRWSGSAWVQPTN